MDEFTRVARVFDKEPAKRLRGLLNVRPLKLAFIISTSIPQDKFGLIVDYQSTIWGGRFNLFVPTDGRVIQKNWLNSIRQHNSDVIILCQMEGIEYSPTLLSQLNRECDPLRIDYWTFDTKDFGQLHYQGFQEEYGLPTAAIISHVYRRERIVSKETSNAAVITGNDQNQYHFSLKMRFGSLKDNYLRAFVDVFKAKEIEIQDVTNLADYLRVSKELQGKFTPLSLSGYDIRFTESFFPYNRPTGINIFIIGNNPILDLCLAWNFKLSPSVFGRASESIELLLSESDLDALKHRGLLVSSIKEGLLGDFSKVNFHSLSVSLRKMRVLESRFSKLLKNKNISVYREIPPVAEIQMSNQEIPIELLLEDGQFLSKKERPRIDPAIFKGAWINEFQFRDAFNRRYQFPDSSGLNSLLSTHLPENYRSQFGYLARQTGYGLAFRVNSASDFMIGRIPPDFEVFSALFEDKGLKIKLNVNHSYIVGLQTMFSEVGGQKNFADESVRRLLWETARLNKGFSLNELKQLLKRNDESLIDSLVRAGIFLRGMEFVCENCGLRRWYSVDLIEEVMECIGCRKKVRLPLKGSFAFKLNQLVTTALSAGGGMAVSLLEYSLSRMSLGRPVSIFGADVSQANGEANIAEIDLLTQIDGQTIVSEAKDFKNGLTSKQFKEAIEQIKKLAELAKGVGANVVLFASFSGAYANEFADVLQKLSTRFGIPVNAVNLQSEEVLDLNSKLFVPMTKTPFDTFMGMRKKSRRIN